MIPDSPAILRDERVPWVLALLFAVAGIEAVLHGRYFHDEGILSWYFASLLGHDPIAGLFFQKLRPALALVYAPVAALGFRPFALVHTLVGASAIPLIAALARHFGHRAPNVAALVLASSPLMLAAAPGGHSNADAAAGLVFACWLLFVRKRPGAAGAVLAALLFVRSEIAPFVLIIVGERLWSDRSNNWRLLVGVVAVPGLYALAGSFYHHDLLWALHYPPALAHPTPRAHWLDDAELANKLGRLHEALFALSPALPLALFVRRPPNSPERAQALALCLFVAAIRGFPLLGLFNFDTSPRYLLCGLPALALLVSRQVDDSFERQDNGAFGLATLSILAAASIWASTAILQDMVFPFIAAAALAIALSRSGRPRVALATWVLPALGSLAVWPTHTGIARPRAALDRLATVWTEELADYRGPVVTNFALARPWLEFRGLLDPARTPLHFIVQYDMAFELDRLLHAEVGQREAIYAGLEQHFYGPPVAPDQLVPEAWPPGTIVIFRADDDLADTIDVDRWEAAMTVFAETDELTFARLHEVPQ